MIAAQVRAWPLVLLMSAGLFVARPARAAPPAPALDASYQDADGFFSLDYPSAWTANRARSEMQFMADRNGSAGLAISLQIKATSPENLVDAITDVLAGRRDNFKELRRREVAIDGFSAVWADHGYQQQGQAHLGFIAAAVRNRVGFLMVGWAPKANYAKLKPTFEAMVGSLRIARFDDSPPYEDWRARRSGPVTIHYLPQTYVARNIKAIARDHERVYSEIAQALEVDYDESIDFYLYPSAESLFHATAREAGHANNEAGEVHAIWVSAKEHQSLGHEMTHVITHGALGDPAEALLGEGIAVCLDHSGKDHHAIAADLLRNGRLIPLEDMLGDAWFEHDGAVTYPQSGSFACFLLHQYGVAEFKAVYAAQDFRSAVRKAYGVSLASIEKRWLKMLKSYRGGG